MSGEKASAGDQFAKAELDADEPQRPDCRVRELPGDMAHELSGERNENEVWELPGDMAHELRGETNENEVRDLPGDMTHVLIGGC